MAFSEAEREKIEKAMEVFLEKRRPPVHVRDQVDLEYRIEDQSVEIIEVRPYWRDPGRKTETPIAKATFVRSRDVWKVYWQRADTKWHKYVPLPEVDTLEQFLYVVDEDEHGGFFG
jgi:hypothetical protein